MTAASTETEIVPGNPTKRASRVEDVPIALIRVSQKAQREIKNEWVSYLAQNFDPDKFGTLTVNLREDGFYYAADGQHRIEAMRLMGWDDQLAPCTVYAGLTEEEEAQLFLGLNHRLAVSALSQFKVSITAGDADDRAIADILSRLNLKAGRTKTGGSVSAIGTLRRVYRNFGPEVLSRALALVSAGFGDQGLGAAHIEGMAMFVERYGSSVDDEKMIKKLNGVHAGAAGLAGTAATKRRIHSQSMTQCIAAALVDLANSGRGGFKLRDWWATSAGATVRGLRAAG